MRRGLIIVSTAVVMIVGWAGAASAAAGWAIQPSNAGGGSVLHGVSCLSPASCVAVGAQNSGTLAESWDGTTWTVQPAPNPSGATYKQLVSVSCASATSCTAVGWFNNPAGGLSPLIEHWDGSTWAIQATPIPVGAVSVHLMSVSCAPATNCTAVGSFARKFSTANVDRPLAERWNGSQWRIEAVPMPSGSVAAALSGVSCRSSRSCTATGSYNLYPREPNSQTLAEHWDGTTWTIQATPNAAGATENGLSGVSCASLTSCTAVGSYQIGSPNGQLLAEHWDGTAWTIQAAPVPAGTTSSGLGSVSCVTPANCTAVGSTSAGLLAEHWNGSTWAIEHVPSPAGSVAVALETISCTLGTSCTAVGQYFHNNYKALIEAR